MFASKPKTEADLLFYMQQFYRLQFPISRYAKTRESNAHKRISIPNPDATLKIHKCTYYIYVEINMNKIITSISKHQINLYELSQIFT